jgi:predicted O-methyltransferase YrrM
MSFIPSEIETYCENHSSALPSVLADLERETHLKTLYPQMLSGQLQGAFLSIVSRITQPRRILEIGTFTGYSAICLATGLSDDGILHTLESDEELFGLASKYIELAGLKNKIIQHTGNALEIIPTLAETWDLVFIDAAKKEYLDYYRLIFPFVKSGGIILADNTLWDGKVLDPQSGSDAAAIDEFNNFIHTDERVDVVLLPHRDGISVIRKRA